MATILVVDDRPTNRDFLLTFLGYRGHRLLEAADGAEALEVAQAACPDLIISDILMPTMDGYEFVRQLRADPALSHTAVIFSTAHYLDQEASALAQQCGVAFILSEPCDPETVLDTVDATLGLTLRSTTHPSEEEFDREHLRLLTNQLAHKAAELQGLSEKLAALLELGQYQVSERNPRHLLERHCRGARDIIGAKWAIIGMLDEDAATLQRCFTSGLDPRHCHVNQRSGGTSGGTGYDPERTASMPSSVWQRRAIHGGPAQGVSTGLFIPCCAHCLSGAGLRLPMPGQQTRQRRVH
jgi:two-component system, cell cycle sensor histidine kinase and response regulator CckA